MSTCTPCGQFDAKYQDRKLKNSNHLPEHRIHSELYIRIQIQINQLTATVPCPKQGLIHRRRVMPLMKQALYPQATPAGSPVL